MRNTVGLLRRNKQVFLTREQIECIIALLATGSKREVKQALREVINNSFYSLEDSNYWDRFFIEGNYVIYEGRQAERHRKDLREIRDDILKQRGLL